MSDFELYIDDKLVDGLPDDVIAFTYVLNDFGKLNGRQTPYSKQFKLKKTPNNASIFGTMEDLSSSTVAPYRKMKAEAKSGGVALLKGVSKVDESADYYNVTILGESSDWFSIAKDTKLEDLDTSDHDHTYTASNVNARRQATSGVVYPYVDYNRITPSVGDSVAHTKFYPSFYVKTLLAKFEELTGYTFVGTEYIHRFDDLVIPFCRERLAYKLQLECKMSRTSTTTLTPSASFPQLVFVPFNYEDFDPDDLLISNTYFNTPYECTLDITSQLNWDRTTGGYGAGDLTASLVKMNGSLQFSVIDEVVLPASSSGTAILTAKDITANEDDDILIVISGDSSNSVDIDASSYFEVTKGYATGSDGLVDIVSGDLIKIHQTFPDITIADLLRTLINQNLLILSTSISRKTITLFPFSNLYANRYRAVDWSNKLDLSFNPKVYYRLSKDYGRENVLSYIQDDDDPKEDGYRFGSFQIDDEILSSTKSQFESVFAASSRYQKTVTSIEALKINRYSDTSISESDPDIKPEPRIAYVEITSDNLIQVTSGGSTLANAAELFFSELTWSEIMVRAYSEFQDMVYHPKRVIERFRLSAADIQQLNFEIPIWVDYHKSYFYLNQIKEYYANRDEKSSLVELIKL